MLIRCPSADVGQGLEPVGIDGREIPEGHSGILQKAYLVQAGQDLRSGVVVGSALQPVQRGSVAAFVQLHQFVEEPLSLR